MMFPLAAIAPVVVLRPKLAWIVPLVLPAGFVLGIYTVGENSCSFYPSIDTVYAPGYRDAAFDRVLVGASADVVRAALGEPLWVARSEERPGEETWCYTLDGKCRWGDWAWLARSITLRDGRVESKDKEIRYD